MKNTDFEKLVLHFLNTHSKTTYSSKEIFKNLKIQRKDYPSFRRILKNLALEKRIERIGKRRYGSKKTSKFIIGRFSLTKYGYGFVLDVMNKREIFIPKGMTGTALDKDIVKVEVNAGRKGKSYEGEVIEVIKRENKHIIGTYMETEKRENIYKL